MSNIQNIEQAIQLIEDSPYNEITYRKIAVNGMLVHIKNNMPSGTAYQDSLEIINQLSLAKYKLDCGCSHMLAITIATSNLLLKTQEYFDSEVIPCTEWPTPDELLEFVTNHAQSA
jgi:hypothetical protein